MRIEDIRVKPEDVYKKKVVPSGNGAVIPFYKEHIGKDVYVVVIRSDMPGRSSRTVDTTSNRRY